MDNIKKIKQTSDVNKVLNKISLEDISEIIKILNEKYYEGETLISDEIYDKIIEYVNKKYPDNDITKKIGYEPKNKVKLPYYMGSENKIYDEDEKKFNNWIEKYGTSSIIVSVKADGISVLWDIGKNKLYTRGDGNYGKDISWFLKYMNYDLPELSDYVIRGELVINKDKTRNDVAGAINSLEANRNEDILKEIYFVGYEILNPRFNQENQFKKLKQHKIRHIKAMKYDIEDVSLECLSELYQELKPKMKYDIDGLVIRNNNVNDPITDGNPPWSFAYKPPNTIYTTKVLNVIWQISKQNKYIPIAELEPIKLENKTIKRVSCYNAKFVTENGIGTDAIVEIEYRGGAIPKLVNVIKPVTVDESDLPDGKIIDNHLYAPIDSKESNIKIISQFFKILSIQAPNKKVIEHLYDNGITNIVELLKSDLTELLDTTKKINKNALHSINIAKSIEISLPLAIAALSIPNLTEKVLEKIYNTHKDFLTTKQDFEKIKGINKLSAEKIKSQILKNKNMIDEYLKLIKIK
ncbi:NAD-dependent DNA ligase [Melanoplus sanguinipes entomopoxvirus]|uniref:ORF MSV162 putative NAD+ dependent DNA ligase, similar to Thermus thermophilus SW:P26996 n=1 Tax=Melanoplus sanguinipes entomopoxvirus TaxID=83191 RepID=Q9YVT0_MSEPV|nr:NAD-dependent DNA ligase [Melanoplus sanguinipes entomopoxvirus]AAC97679.1 ORF MSV162 putative NAD+ dependent DNA ligase, similar to Thermus thermophilus SW:P26996 [Melanoplus sanguinipes entomopoxvirus 'O']